MNCKPGDLAIVVRSYAGNEGKIVRCMELCVILWENPQGGAVVLPSWRIDRPLIGPDGSWKPICADEQLRPIRDSDPSEKDIHELSLPSVPSVREVA